MVALFDFLKRKKEVEKAKEKAPERKVEKASVAPKAKKEKKETPLPKGKKIKGFSHEVVKEPHISEKGTNLADKNQYVFKVYASANKPEIKKSIEGIYGVDVVAVNVIKIPHKKRRLGRHEGFRKGFRKAVVTVKEGQKIEIF